VERFICKQNLTDFCITNKELLTGAIRGFTVEFPGFDGNSCLSGNFTFARLDNCFARALAEKDILLVYVFTGPWNWMRDASVKTVDDIIDAVRDKYALPANMLPVLTGGSMGGLGALSYARYGKHPAAACAVSCPVCDLFEAAKFSHFFAASVYFAVAHYSGSYEQAVKSLSPLYFARQLPDIPYFVLWCSGDDVIPADKNAIPMMAALKEVGYRMQTLCIPDAGHCVHTPEALQQMIDFICEKALF